MIVLFILSISVACITYVLLKKLWWVLRAIKLTSNIQGPTAWPIIGSAHLFLNLKTTKDTFDKLLQYTKECTDLEGKIMKLWLGPKLIILLCHPKHISTFLSHTDANDKDDVFEYLKLGSGGVAVSNGTKWKELRKPLNKFLNKKTVKTHVDIFNEKSVLYCKVLKKFADNGEVIDVHCLTHKWAIDILSKTNFGYDINELENNHRNIPELTRKTIDIVYTMMFHPPHCLSLTYAKLSKSGRELRSIVEQVWNFLHEIFDGRRAELEKYGASINRSTPAYYGDFLMKKALDDKLSREEAAKIATDFLAAGSDTSGAIMNCTILLLAMHPEHQEAVYKELIDLLGDNLDIHPNWEDLNDRMPYTTRVLQEVLRLYSPPITARKTSTDIVVGNYTIPEGATVFSVYRSLHMDPTIWLHPDQFYPDHFLPEEVAKRPKGVYYPFSWGLRGCPGTLYAMAEMKCLLSHIIRKYKLSTHLKFDELVYSYRLIIDMTNEYLITFKHRNK